MCKFSTVYIFSFSIFKVFANMISVIQYLSGLHIFVLLYVSITPFWGLL